jgi:uncharacterized SAM-binding protein YcdF (DUF218 family)
LVNSLLYAYETSYNTLKIAPKEVKYIYVLGGGHHSDNALPITSQVNASAVVRLNEGIRLFRQLKEKPILIVSGFSTLSDNTPHAILQEKLALSLGVPKEKLHLEPRVQDTQEEALAAKKYIKDAPFILVTSASHMPRAMRFFNHVGLHPIAAPTNHLAHVTHPNYFAFFSEGVLKKSKILWHELLGSLWQKLKGI